MVELLYRQRYLLFSITIAVASISNISDAFLTPILEKKIQPPLSIVGSRLNTIVPCCPTIKSTTRLHYKLWERLQIEEDPEPFWYLINCVAGLEMDLLKQCREVCADMPDAIKFVVPTEKKTRSHGANRMVTETKVKYQGYVFAKLRLCPEVYEAIQSLDLCRSWMGTVNHKGHKKLPPAPVALNELEVENFGLDDMEEEEEDEEEIPLAEGEQEVILDEAGADKKDKVDEEAIKAYLGLKVEDMVKVTKKCKFYEEDGIVRRLKDGKILVRFYTYGSMFEEWMEPGDVRKLSEIEVLKGLQGPTQPITQHDFDNPGRGDNRFESGVRRGPATFRGDLMSNVKGTGGPRNRRQDRIQRGQAGDFFGRTEDEHRREERNWDWYKENKRGKDGVVADDEWQYRPGSAGRSNDDWALGDSDSQWGRQPSQRQQQKERRQHKNDRSNDDDWGKFVSPASAPGPAEEDDFFNSLMSDLSKDLNTGEKGPKGARPAQDSTTSATESEEDDFFASLMAEIAPEAENESSNNGESDSSMFVDDFFFSLASSSQEEDDKGEKSEGVDSIFDEDDFFKSFDVGSGDSSKDKSMDSDDMFDILDIEREQSSEERASVASEADDFFASLEEELGNALEERESSRSSLNDSDDDFFASLEEEVSSKLEASSEVEKDKVAPKAEKEQSQPKAQKANRAKSLNPGDLESMKVPELKEMLRERGLKVTGKKAELIERLMQ